MSVQALSWVFDHSPTTGSDRLVLLAIANHADIEGAHSFPGIDTLAREARVSRATAKRAIRGLEDHQHIDVVHGIGRGHPNLYRVVTDPARVGIRRATQPRRTQGGPVTVVPTQTAQNEPDSGSTKKRAQSEPVQKRAHRDPVSRSAEGAQSEPDVAGKGVHLRSEKGSPATEKGLTCEPLTVKNRHRTEKQRTRAGEPPHREDDREPSEVGSTPDAALFALGDVPTRTDTDVRRVFDEWVRVTGRTDRTRLDDKRRALIARQLKHYPVDDLMDAVRGWQRSPFHRGQNATGEPVHDLRQLIGDAEHLERFRDLARAGRPADRGPTNPSDASIGRFPTAGEVRL